MNDTVHHILKTEFTRYKLPADASKGGNPSLAP
jgi:hypothetical protein